MSRHKVLFLCTGNSCRSQMAEAIVNTRLGDRWLAQSAGVRPAGFVSPYAIRVLAELGIEHQGASKHVEVYKEAQFDLVVTVCDDAAEECPMWLGTGHKVHLGFRDPMNAQGTEDEVMAVYRSVLDEIAEKIPQLLAEHEKSTG